MAGIDMATVHGTANQVIELPIAQGPATGYSWSLDLPSGVTRTSDGPGHAPPAGQELGAAVGTSLRVVAAAGQYKIIARLARTWGKDEPARTVVIDLIVK